VVYEHIESGGELLTNSPTYMGDTRIALTFSGVGSLAPASQVSCCPTNGVPWLTRPITDHISEGRFGQFLPYRNI
jgi:hypothetical protein